MARQFNGINQELRTFAQIDLSSFNKATVGEWLWWDAYADDSMMALHFTPSSANNGGFRIFPNRATNSNFCFSAWDNASQNHNEIARSGMSAGAWHHVLVKLDRTLPPGSNPVAEVYIDGSLKAFVNTTTDVALGNFANDFLAVMSINGTSNFAAGRVAELAIWGGVLLSGAQIASLQTQTPDLVGSPTFGWHILGNASPEPNFVGGVDLVVTGATQVAHPPALSGGAANVSGRTAARQRRQELLGARGWHG